MQMTTPSLEKTWKDKLHLAARATLSAIPGVGGPALELFNAVIAPPIERRRDSWLNELAERLQTLEQEHRLNIEDLANNENFVSAVMQATSSAIRTHHEKKIDALRNAVLNSALDRSLDEVKREIFLALVDQLTAIQIVVFAELSKFPSGQQHVSAISKFVASRI